jgi:hypothetical protein
VLRAASGLRTAALGAALLLGLTFGLGDVANEAVLSGLRALLWGTVGLALLAALLSRRASIPASITLPLAAWLAILLLSAILAPGHTSEALNAWARPVSGALLAWTAYVVTPSASRWRLLAASLALGGLAVSLIGLAEMAGLPLAAPLHDTPLPVADVPRLTSTLSHPNVAAAVLEVTLPLLLAVIVSAPRTWRPLVATLLLAHLAALTLTFSRAGILASAASLVVLAAVAARRGAWRIAVPVGAAAFAAPLGLALAAGVLPQVERRLVAEVSQAGFQATYTAPALVAAGPEQVLDIPVRVTNAGSSSWSARDDSRVALGYHLLRADGTPLDFDRPATLVPGDVAPKASLDMVVQVRAPATAGWYLVEWDALREGVAWFSWRGSPTAAMNLLVEPTLPRSAPPALDAEVALPRPARVQFWTAAWGMLRDQPLLGVGPDNFRMRFVDYAGIDESHIGTHAHSLYLESLADTGVLGFAALGWLLLRLVSVAGHGLGTPTDHDWVWRAALFASLVAWLVHGLLDDFERFLPAHLAYWLLVGLLLRGSQLVQRAHRPE